MTKVGTSDGLISDLWIPGWDSRTGVDWQPQFSVLRMRPSNVLLWPLQSSHVGVGADSRSDLGGRWRHGDLQGQQQWRCGLVRTQTSALERFLENLTFLHFWSGISCIRHLRRQNQPHSPAWSTSTSLQMERPPWVLRCQTLRASTIQKEPWRTPWSHSSCRSGQWWENNKHSVQVFVVGPSNIPFLDFF